MDTSLELVNSKITMSSLEIAELTGKEHKHVLEDIRSVFNEEIQGAEITAYLYKDSRNRSQEAYSLNKEQCLVLLSGYSSDLRKKIIRRWQELEGQQKPRELSLAEMTLKVIAGFQEEVATLKGVVVRKQRQMIGAKGGHTKEKNKLKKKAEYYEKLAEERNKVFWWNKE